MSESSGVDLFAPVEADTVLEVRSGKMKNMEGLSIQSGIDKTLCSGSVAVTSMGIVGDEHDYTVRCPPTSAASRAVDLGLTQRPVRTVPRRCRQGSPCLYVASPYPWS